MVTREKINARVMTASLVAFVLMNSSKVSHGHGNERLGQDEVSKGLMKCILVIVVEKMIHSSEITAKILVAIIIKFTA